MIIRCIGGLYTVKMQNGERIECKARGLFRKDGFRPIAGDMALLSDEGEATVIAEVLPRKNEIARPPIANIDRLIMVFSVAEPNFNADLLDKMLAIAEHSGINCSIVITKADLDQIEDILSLYRRVGYPCIAVSKDLPNTSELVRELLVDGINVFCGNSGVGKTTLLNLMLDLNQETAEISKKLGRGKHTTRQAELFEIEGKFIADTPGFSALDIEHMRLDINEQELSLCFKEFNRYREKCKYSDCRHINEPFCGVRKAIEDGEIARSRYSSYLRLLEEVKRIKKW